MSRVCIDGPEDVDSFKIKIREVAAIFPEIIENAINSFQPRMAHYQIVNGAHFEQIL